ncbi:MAG: hypothetical protein E6G56_08795 [Actinobacteria bacterium]|nr:MAG: hypothetical protein E6G56_08795 [Actinomycetota bacterium]
MDERVLRSRGRGPRRATGAAVLLIAALASAAPAAPAAPVTFSGRIVSGSGRYAGASGAVTVVVRSSVRRNPRGLPARFAIVLDVRCRRRGRARRAAAGARSSSALCLRGKLRGSAEQTGSRLPDVGLHYAIAAHGRVKPLGAVAARGSASGTGFIDRARMGMALRLSNRLGSVSLEAHSDLVSGFSSPF